MKPTEPTARLRRLRAEILLLLSLLVPLGLGSFGGGDVLLAGVVRLLPAPSGAAAESANPWRDATYRLIDENARLRRRLLALADAERLRAMDPAFFRRNPFRVEAEVTGRDVSLWRRSLLLSAGTGAGVAPGQAVVMGRRLVGLVSEAGPFSSRVRLLVDPGARVWGVIPALPGRGEKGKAPPGGAGPSGKGEAADGGGVRGEGVVVGTGDEVLLMRGVRSGAGAPGSPVFTGAGRPGIPRGLLIGVIESVSDRDRDGIAEIRVRPAAPAAAVDVVNVLVPGSD